MPKTAALYATLQLSFFAILHTTVPAKGEEICSPFVQMPATAGDALVQTKRFRDVSLWAAPATLALQEADSKLGRHCLPILPAGLEDVDLGLNSKTKLRTSLLAAGTKRSSDGKTAPLDASGFKDTTLLCCPVEMEVFFNRLLDKEGFDICSKPHVQGLMHWFSCVPDMDFQYVLDVIANGNPCKYWAPKGQICPALSAACKGHYCTSATEPPEEVSTETTEPPAEVSTESTEPPEEVSTETTEPPEEVSTETTEPPEEVSTETTEPLEEVSTETTSPATTTEATTTEATTTTPITTTTQKAMTTECSRSASVKLDFSPSTPLLHNNLGGIGGPNAGPEELRLGNVGDWDGTKFDLIITADDSYQPAASGFYSAYPNFLFLGLLRGRQSTFKFQFVHSGTDTAIVLPELHLTVLDIDGAFGIDQDVNWARSDSGYVADVGTDLVTEEVEGGLTAFRMRRGLSGEQANPKDDPMKLTAQQRKLSVMYVFKDTSEFELIYAIQGSRRDNSRRNLQLSGGSMLEDRCLP
jgi:hypothetical protein